jgi:hypothetical protein
LKNKWQQSFTLVGMFDLEEAGFVNMGPAQGFDVVSEGKYAPTFNKYIACT